MLTNFALVLCTTNKKLFKDFQRQHLLFQRGSSLFRLKQILDLPTVSIFDSFRTIFEKIENSKHPRSPSKQPPKPATTFLFLSDSLLLLSSLWDQVTDWVWALHSHVHRFFPPWKHWKSINVNIECIFICMYLYVH